MAPKKPFDKNEWFGKILNYSDFLEQPLNLGMFVPCKLVDGVWVVLEEPVKTDRPVMNDFRIKALKEYQEAKDRVLFEGFKVERTFVSDGTYFDHVDIDYLVLFKKYNNSNWFNCSEITYLESLTMLDLTLTPTAQKQLS